jgi:hypothetical protein
MQEAELKSLREKMAAHEEELISLRKIHICEDQRILAWRVEALQTTSKLVQDRCDNYVAQLSEENIVRIKQRHEYRSAIHDMKIHMQILAAAYERRSVDLQDSENNNAKNEIELLSDMDDQGEIDEFSIHGRKIARLERDRKDLLELLMAVWQNVPPARGYMQPLSNFAQACREATGQSEEILEFSAEGLAAVPEGTETEEELFAADEQIEKYERFESVQSPIHSEAREIFLGKAAQVASTTPPVPTRQADDQVQSPALSPPQLQVQEVRQALQKRNELAQVLQAQQQQQAVSPVRQIQQQQVQQPLTEQQQQQSSAHSPPRQIQSKATLATTSVVQQPAQAHTLAQHSSNSQQHAPQNVNVQQQQQYPQAFSADTPQQNEYQSNSASHVPSPNMPQLHQVHSAQYAPTQHTPSQYLQLQQPNEEMQKWRAVQDKASGRTYYYHVETKQTTWTWPPPQQLEQSDSQPQSNVVSGAPSPYQQPPQQSAAQVGKQQYAAQESRQHMHQQQAASTPPVQPNQQHQPPARLQHYTPQGSAQQNS